MTVVLASFVPPEQRFRSKRHRVVGIPCTGELDYAHGLQHFWGTEHTIINVEHDMECSDGLIDQLLACPEPFCTHAYLLYPVTTGRSRAHYAQRVGAKPPAGGDWVREGVEWCDFTGIGFCKIITGVRTRPLKERAWQTLDCEVAKATDARVHIHWPPVEHSHKS